MKFQSQTKGERRSKQAQQDSQLRISADYQRSDKLKVPTTVF
jgi:hypothetical protein